LWLRKNAVAAGRSPHHCISNRPRTLDHATGKKCYRSGTGSSKQNRPVMVRPSSSYPSHPNSPVMGSPLQGSPKRRTASMLTDGDAPVFSRGRERLILLVLAAVQFTSIVDF